jgi:hypothetical protein
MKTLKLLLVSILSTSLLFTSCSSDDSDSDTGNKAELIQGSWRFVSSTTNGITDTFEDSCALLLTLSFTDSPLVRQEFSGDNCEFNSQINGSYEIKGEILTISFPEATIPWLILTLDEVNLSIMRMSNGITFIENYSKVAQNSDRRLKKDIENLSYGLKEIMQLQPKAYNWKNRKQNHKSLGLIAQDVQPIINNIVHQQNNKEKTLSISYIELIPILIKAIQEQQDVISNQNKINTELTQRIGRIEATSNQ